MQFRKLFISVVAIALAFSMIIGDISLAATDMLQDPKTLTRIVDLAAQGKVIGSEEIVLGATHANVIQKWGNPPAEIEESIPDKSITTLVYDSGLAFSFVNIGDIKKMYRVGYLVSQQMFVGDEYAQRWTYEKMVEVLGEPYKTTTVSRKRKEQVLKKLMEQDTDEQDSSVLDLDRLQILIYTYKAGQNYVHFTFAEFEVDQNIHLNVVNTAVDANCETLDEAK